jgi:hypothetical protein
MIVDNMSIEEEQVQQFEEKENIFWLEKVK